MICRLLRPHPHPRIQSAGKQGRSTQQPVECATVVRRTAAPGCSVSLGSNPRDCTWNVPRSLYRRRERERERLTHADTDWAIDGLGTIMMALYDISGPTTPGIFSFYEAAVTMHLLQIAWTLKWTCTVFYTAEDPVSDFGIYDSWWPAKYL